MSAPLPPPLPGAPSPATGASPPARSFPRQAATFSLYAPFAAIGLNIALQQTVRGSRAAMLVLGLTSTLLILLGFIFGIMALAATRRHGRQGIFGKSIAGICINGLLILLMLLSIPGLIRAAERARELQRQRMEQRP